MRDQRRSRMPALLVALALLAGVAVVPSAGADPVGSPPGGGHVLDAGQIPTVCTQAEFDAGASAYSSNYGYYWSETSSRWISAPWYVAQNHASS